MSQLVCTVRRMDELYSRSSARFKCPIAFPCSRIFCIAFITMPITKAVRQLLQECVFNNGGGTTTPHIFRALY